MGCMQKLEIAPSRPRESAECNVSDHQVKGIQRKSLREIEERHCLAY